MSTTQAKHTTGPWLQGINAGSRHWVVVPDAVKGINAGNAERAALIVRSVNNYPKALEAIASLLEDAFPAVTSSIQAAHDFLLSQGYEYSYDECEHIRYSAAKATGEA